MSELKDHFDCAVSLVPKLLEEKCPVESYALALEAFRDCLAICTADEIDASGIDPYLVTSLKADKNLLHAFPANKDQVSLLSTLVIYEKCHLEGLPNHSRVYMDQVTQIRKQLDSYYGEKVQQFCGS